MFILRNADIAVSHGRAVRDENVGVRRDFLPRIVRLSVVSGQLEAPIVEIRRQWRAVELEAEDFCSLVLEVVRATVAQFLPKSGRAVLSGVAESTPVAVVVRRVKADRVVAGDDDLKLETFANVRARDPVAKRVDRS